MSEFVENLHEVFAPFAAIRSRRMFGGFGIYREDLMFALVSDEVLYLKVDDDSIALFEAAGMSPFIYEKNGRRSQMSYWTAPEDIYDHSDAARLWAQRAWDAALRSRRPRRKTRT